MKTWLIFIYLAPSVLTILLVQNEGVDGREEVSFQNSSQAGPGGPELQQNSCSDSGVWSLFKRWINFKFPGMNQTDNEALARVLYRALSGHTQNEGVDGREEESGISFQNSTQTEAGGQECQQNSGSDTTYPGFWRFIRAWMKSKVKNDCNQQEKLNNPEKEAIPQNEETADLKAESNRTRREEQIESVLLNATEPSPGGAIPAIPTIVPTTIQTTNSNPLQRCQPNPWASCTEATEEDKIQLAEALTEFAIKLYSAAIKLEKSDSNLVFSPFSIAMLLSNLLLGARGETKEDFAKLLSYPEEFICIHDAMSTFRKSEVLTAASAIFTQPAISLNEDFSRLSQKLYHSKIQKLTNVSDNDVNEINDWVRRNTDYKIKNLLDQLDSDVQMVLLNAVYFHSKWKTIFKTKHTIEENFYRPGLPPSKVPMMTSKKYPLAFFTDHSLQAKVGRLQLSHNMSLVVIVPQTLAQNLSDVEKRLSGDVFKSIMAKLGHISFKSTVLTIPKFKVDSSLDLMSVVAEMAYGIFFDANLCGMAENEELTVSSARHRAVMEINEEGVEAAAATAISLARTASFFEVQQPFIFAVVNQKNIPIFMGRINNPKA